MGSMGTRVQRVRTQWVTEDHSGAGGGRRGWGQQMRLTEEEGEPLNCVT